MKEHINPTIIVIFGGTGDLNSRKLGPALYNLYLEGYMPEKFELIGTARSKLTDANYCDFLEDGIKNFSRKGKALKKDWQKFVKHVSYTPADIKDPESLIALKNKIEKRQAEFGPETQVIYYLAVAPTFFSAIADSLHKYGLAGDKDHTRIVIEKPFGHDLESAQQLNKMLKQHFKERQIYRIDHYLGKEAVQNIMAFRFANSLFEPLWNRNYIEHVQISVSEAIGVEDRGSYYDGAGALRDMIQNHLLQLLCIIAMEPPTSFDANEIRNRKVDALKSIRKFNSDSIRKNTVRGQYSDGWVNGVEVPGYRTEKDVEQDSNTETYAAFKFNIDNWRWQGVPFYLRTGKRMQESSSIISIQFKDVPHQIFQNESVESWHQNRLIISIQPEMSIRLQVQAKRPGLDMVLNPVDMIFDYKGTNNTNTPEAYETLLLDVMTGDQTLFMRVDQVEYAWELLMPILNNWGSKKSINFPNYKSGSWGPEEAEALIAKSGFFWYSLPIKNKD